LIFTIPYFFPLGQDLEPVAFTIRYGWHQWQKVLSGSVLTSGATPKRNISPSHNPLPEIRFWLLFHLAYPFLTSIGMISEIKLQENSAMYYVFEESRILCFRLCGTVISNLGNGLSNEIRTLGLLAKQQFCMLLFNFVSYVFLLLYLLYSKPTHALLLNTLSHPHFLKH
jgi:hypothetical protein